MACGFGTLVVVLLLLFASLAATVVAVITNYWFIVKTQDLSTVEYTRGHNYHLGLWVKCYDDPPTAIPASELTGADRDCVEIYRNLTSRQPDGLSGDQELVVNLSRSYVCLSLAFAAGQLATLLVLLCGSWPGDCASLRRSGLYWAATVLLLVTALFGIASGICFIAARDVENDALRMFRRLDVTWGWSFMCHWGACALTVMADFLLVCLVKHAPDEINKAKLYYYNM